MKYSASVWGNDQTVVIDKEGLRIGKEYIDYSVVAAFRAINYRVVIDLMEAYSPAVKTVPDSQIEISMLGRSFDGFWEELMNCYGDRSLKSLFVEGPWVMKCEGDYEIPEGGRGTIFLYPDSICIVPQTKHAVRIPLCFTEEIRLDGYQMTIRMNSGKIFKIGRMGYDTQPFAERALSLTAKVKKQRMQMIQKLRGEAPFSSVGVFRTYQDDIHYGAAFGEGRCALELYTGESAATYLYEFGDPRELFGRMLSEAMEAMGPNREVIYLDEEQLKEKPLYMMAVERSEAVRFLRGKLAGRVIHNAAHAQKVREFLER